MRSVAGALSTHIQNAQKVYGADLYTITLINGTVIRWTGSDAVITTGGNTYSVGPIINRGKMKWRMGLQTDELQFTVTPRSASLDQVGGVSLYQAAQRGDFFGAAFKLARLYADAPGGTVLDVVNRFTGRIAKIDMDAGGVQFTAQSMLYLLEKPFPANTYQPQCANVLFDSMCQAAPSSFRSTGSISSVTTQSVLQTSLSSLVANVFRLGRFKFLTGANAGVQRAVKSNNTTGLMYFGQPWPAPVVAGDTFEVFQGCDKTQSTCSSKFSNLIHFRGQPFVPLPETTT